jgi:hypothetical protein
LHNCRSSLLLLLIGVSLIWAMYVNSTFAQIPKNQSETTSNNTTPRFATLSVATDRIKYVEGQSIAITGTIYDEEGKPVITPINVKVQEMFPKELKFNEGNNTETKVILATGRTVYGVNLIPTNGTYKVVIDRGLMEGKYNITSYVRHASAKEFKVDIEPGTSTIIDVEAFLYTAPVRTLIAGGLVGGIGMFLLIMWTEVTSHKRIKKENCHDSKKILLAGKEGKPTYEETAIYQLCQFVIITIFAFTPIATLAFTDVAIFPNSPIGVVIKPISDNVLQSAGEWMINFGGSSFDGYQSGIQVPIAIFIFGTLGGYLKYLYSIVKEHRVEENGTKKQLYLNLEPHENLFVMLQEITFLFLSPLLAIAVWLVLRQGGLTSILTLSAVSFVIGLVTDEAVSSLIRFVRGVLGERIPRTSTRRPAPSGGGEQPAPSGGGEQPSLSYFH